MGTGTLAEALAWVEYCNGAGTTEWAQRRRRNGREGALRVRYWGLGNEMYGDWQVGAMSAEEYVREATRWARAIKMLDPDAVLVSCGMNGWSDWDRSSSTVWRPWSTCTRCTSTPAPTTTGPTCCSRTRPSAPSVAPGH